MPKPKIIAPIFFQRNTLLVAQELLGKSLVREQGENKNIYTITEVEAYDGPLDKASHASKGLTQRTEPMFRSGGCFYIYLVYGKHYMLNIVTDKEGYPAAVLIRGTKEITGPGRLTRDLKIDKEFNQKLVAPQTGLWVEDRGVSVPEREIKATNRIGVDYAGEEWKNKKYRWVWNYN